MLLARLFHPSINRTFWSQRSQRGSAAKNLQPHSVSQKATKKTKGAESPGSSFPLLPPVQIPRSEDARKRTTLLIVAQSSDPEFTERRDSWVRARSIACTASNTLWPLAVSRSDLCALCDHALEWFDCERFRPAGCHLRPNLLALLAATLLALAAAHGAIGATPVKPNVIVIVTDDQGWADLACQSARPEVQTPNLDQLAADGVRFTRGYVSGPTCVPSRAGLMTGRYQTRFGMETNDDGPLPASEKTLGDRMREAGYITGLSGKWHLATNRANTAAAKSIPAREILWGDNVRITGENLPGRRGFDEYFCGANKNYAASFDLQGNTLANPPVLVNDPRFRIEVQTEGALAFINRQRGAQPFFLYLAYFAPHVPLEAPERYLARFAKVTDPVRRTGLAMIAAVDDGIGQLRQLLRKRGIERNTLIFFLSDNGAPTKPGMWDGSLNDPLVGEKGMLTDGGIRLPFLAAWPGTIPSGQVIAHPVISLDIMSTALGAAGVEPKAEWNLDGVNLLPFLTGRRDGAPHQALFWRYSSQAAVVSGRWKLLFVAPDRWMLFDHKSAAGESQDVAAQHPAVVTELRARLETWAAGQKPAGLPTKLNATDAYFVERHLSVSAPK